MIDSMRTDAAIGEADNALAPLREKPPMDPISRRRQMALAAKGLLKAAHMLTQFEENERDT